MLFKFVACKTGNTLLSLVVGDEEILGRIKSGLFKLIDGHIYFGNKVIKIRYDLIQQGGGDTIHLNEFHIFDKYENLLDL